MKKIPPAAPALTPLTRARLHDLEVCERRYWLRSVARIPWPVAPPRPEVEESVERGRQFHQLMRRHFLGLGPDCTELPARLAEWWTAWQNHPIPLPPGRRFTETTLSVPLGQQRLLARFDLLVLASQPDGRALILDWKTEARPRSRDQLAADVQTHLYPYVLAEGSTALAGGPPPATAAERPERIEMIYWQANAPANPVRFRYSAERHAANRARFRLLADRAGALQPDHAPPAIDDLAICARCRYRTYCGKEVSPAAAMEEDPEDETTWELALVKE